MWPIKKMVLDAEAPTPVSLSVRKSEGHTFGFPFCQRLWAIAKRRDDIVVADMEVDMVDDMVYLFNNICGIFVYVCCHS